MQKIEIAGKTIGHSRPVFIIAEAGVNHNGSIRLAKRLIDAAKSTGADAVKFQTFKTEALVTPRAPKADYQKNIFTGQSQYQMLKKLELCESQFKEIFNYCRKKKIIFLSTPFDLQSAEFLRRLGVSAFKMGSGELTNFPLLLQVAKYQKPVIVSTGMATIKEVRDAVKTIYSAGNKKLILLHCTSNYPTRYQDVHLNAMATLQKKFKVLVGYSDHTQGMTVAIAAIAMGGCVIEKHLTLNKNLSGPDHKSSCEPSEFRDMVVALRNTQKALGNSIKQPTKSENQIKKVARKSIVAAQDISKGMRLTEEMLTLKRPGTGIAPKYLNALIGRQVKADIKKNRLLTWSAL